MHEELFSQGQCLGHIQQYIFKYIVLFSYSVICSWNFSTYSNNFYIQYMYRLYTVNMQRTSCWPGWWTHIDMMFTSKTFVCVNVCKKQRHIINAPTRIIGYVMRPRTCLWACSSGATCSPCLHWENGTWSNISRQSMRGGAGGGEEKSVRKAGYLLSLMGGIPGRWARCVRMCASWGKTWIHWEKTQTVWHREKADNYLYWLKPASQHTEDRKLWLDQ